jgi:hypothetical protein
MPAVSSGLGTPAGRYLQGIDNAEIIDTVHARSTPMIPLTTSMRL